MKVGFVHTLGRSSAPYCDGDDIWFGPFVSRKAAPEYCPQIYFEFPILRPVTAVVWVAPKASGEYIAMQVFDWSRLKPVGEAEELVREKFGMLPQFSEIDPNPRTELRVVLRCATEYWEPFTSLKAAGKLLPTLVHMNEDERKDFLHKLGQSRNPQTLRIRRERLFIAHRWDEWERHEAPYELRVSDMRRHGLPITLSAFKKRVGQREMNLPRRYRE